MKITRADLFVEIKADGSDLLEDWRWLIGTSAKPLLVSSIGDAFLEDADGVH